MKQKKRKLKNTRSEGEALHVRHDLDTNKTNNSPRNLPTDNASAEPDSGRAGWSNADLRKDRTEDLPD